MNHAFEVSEINQYCLFPKLLYQAEWKLYILYGHFLSNDKGTGRLKRP